MRGTIRPMASGEDRVDADPGTWVDEYGDYLYRYALMRLRNPTAAEDVVQETFLAGIKSLERYDGRAPVKFWLRGILRFKVVDYIRKDVREDPVEDVEGLDIKDSLLFKVSGIPTMRPSALTFDPHRDYEKTEFWEALASCMQGLRGNTQQAFALKVLEGMPTEDVCKVLGIAPNHLWVLTHRARQMLKACLKKSWMKDR
jgi:RNA polymerase sigma-70 factor, ECF subfamily